MPDNSHGAADVDSSARARPDPVRGRGPDLGGAGEGQDLATSWMINLKRGEICALLSDYVEAARAYRQAVMRPLSSRM